MFLSNLLKVFLTKFNLFLLWIFEIYILNLVLVTFSAASFNKSRILFSLLLVSEVFMQLSLKFNMQCDYRHYFLRLQLTPLMHHLWCIIHCSYCCWWSVFFSVVLLFLLSHFSLTVEDGCCRILLSCKGNCNITKRDTMGAFRIAYFCFLVVVCPAAAAFTKYILLYAVCIQFGHTTPSS